MGIHPSAQIASTARVHPEAQIGPDSHIGEYCVIEQDTSIGAGCILNPHVVVRRWTSLGDQNEISSGVVLGSDPLDRGFTGDRSYLTIGHRNKIREQFTISRGTKPESTTQIGNDNFIMTSGHIAHDCRIANNVVIASCALVAGYVHIESDVFISGGVVIHQYSRIGRLAMVGGNTRVNSDLPPFFLYTDFNVAVRGLNLVGLRRAGFSGQDISDLKAAYRILYRSGLKLQEALDRIINEFDSEHVRHLVDFIRQSRRGICRESRQSGDVYSDEARAMSI